MIKQALKIINTSLKVFNFHKANTKYRDIFIFSAPRSGSTWLMEMIASQSRIKYYSEPTNIREKYLRKKMEVSSWDDLLPNENRTKIFERYFNNLIGNKVKLYNPPPFQPNYYFFTNRIVFKMLYANDMINWFEERYKGHVIFLIRHPIPVALSRKFLPVLPHFLKNKEYMESYFTVEQQKLINTIALNGSHLERGTIDWVLQNIPPLKFFKRDNWTFITYEEMIINAPQCIELLCKKLNLSDADKIQRANKRASKTAKTMSDKETLNYIQSDDEKRRQEYLVTKWKKKISNEDESRVFEIIDAFNIDVYLKNNFFPNEKYFNFPEIISKSI